MFKHRSTLARWFTSIVAALLISVSARAEERVIYEKRSALQNILVKEDRDGLRALYLDDGAARQSVIKPGDPEHLESVYTQAAPLVLAMVAQPKRMLIIGLGGGTIATYLHRKVPALKIDVAELDPEVLAVARSHFGFKEDANLKVHVGDGRALIERSNVRYDIVLLDAFGPDAVPDALSTLEFIQAVKRVLTPGGVVVSNIWGPARNAKYAGMVRAYTQTFPSVATLELPKAVNLLVFARERGSLPERAALEQRAARLTRDLKLRVDLAALMQQRYRLIDDREFSTTPALRDPTGTPRRP